MDVDNLKLLTDYFGYTPSFHDAEILSVFLDRNGPDIEMRINLSEYSSNINKDGKYDVIKSCIIVLKFHDIIKMELRDFNRQNVLFDMSIIKDNKTVTTKIESSYGLDGYIISSHVSIVSIS